MKYRGGWKGLLEHMYTNGDYPFKFGTFMGSDMAGNRYYENRVDYPYGQHRWVEPGDIHNFDSSSIDPEWHGWMTSMNDVPPSQHDDYVEERKKNIVPLCRSNAPDDHNVGHQEKLFNFHNLHNQSQVRSRGYGIGNPIVGLPPGVKDSYYTQPGSPYNESNMKKSVMIGDLDEVKGGGRPYKSLKWADRLRTEEERKEHHSIKVDPNKSISEQNAESREWQKRMIRSRGGTLVGDRKSVV